MGTQNLEDTLKEAKVEQPLKVWAADKKGILELMQIYRLANKYYGERFTETDQKISNLSELLEYLNKPEYKETTPVPPKADAFSKMCHVARANVYLRRGQVKANAMADPTDDYRSACTILEQCLASNKWCSKWKLILWKASPKTASTVPLLS